MFADQPIRTLSATNSVLDGLTYFCPNSMVLKRVSSWLDVEPDTIEWLNNFAHESLVIDVGANIGLYSIYSALVGASKVIAVEPDPGNLYVLNSNIWLNRPNLNNICVYAAAAYSKDGLINYYSNHPLVLGHALNQVERAISYENVHTEFTNHEINMYALSLDTLIQSLSKDEIAHFQGKALLKLDVDSLELEILKGAKELLAGNLIKSVLVELDHHDHDHLESIKLLQAAGFSYCEDQVKKSLAHNERNFPTMGHICNYIFTKDVA